MWQKMYLKGGAIGGTQPLPADETQRSEQGFVLQALEQILRQRSQPRPCTPRPPGHSITIIPLCFFSFPSNCGLVG